MAKLTDRIKKAVRDFWNSIPMSVFVVLDESGKPVEMKNAGRDLDDYKSFVKDAVRRHGRGDHIPNYRIERFEFPNQWKVPSSGGDNTRYYRDKLLPAAKKQGVEASWSVSLRDAAFTIKSGLPLLNITTEHDKLARRKDYKEFIAHNEQGRWKEFMQGKAAKYTAVATDQGVMLFTQTKAGEKALHSYLQECAGNFFHPVHGTDNLKIYEVTNPTADVAAKADNYIDRASRRDMRSDDAGLRFSRYGATPEKLLDTAVLDGALCVEKYDMRPDFHNFDRFTGDNTLIMDHKNYEIASLLYIAEHGYGNHLAADYFHPFDRMAEFKALGEKIDDTVRVKGENPHSTHDFGYGELQQQAKTLARDILQTDYHIRDGEFSLGKPLVNIIPLGRPMERQVSQPELAAPVRQQAAKLPPPARQAKEENTAPRRVPSIKRPDKGQGVS